MENKLVKIGIICEYNPFHNGHLYHLKKIKEEFPNSMIILVMSSCFTERGEISLLNKWQKTEIALSNNVDLVLELPFFFATNSADIFAEGAIKILSYMECDYLVFGSENNDIDLLNNLVEIQLNNRDYEMMVREYLDLGHNYPTSMSKALFDITGKTITSPNDLLGLSYIKQIRLQGARIIPFCIKRTNDYHEKTASGEIASATSIREMLANSQDISSYVPFDINNYPLNSNYQERYFTLLKYKIISEQNELEKYLDIKEGLDKRIQKYIMDSHNLEELISNIKTKRYTYNRLKRMFLHILTNLTYDKSQVLHTISYIRVLGFNELGKNHLKAIRREALIPIITNYSQLDDPSLEYELQITLLYNLITNHEELNLQELKSIPINKA